MSVISTLLVKIRSDLDEKGFDRAEQRGDSFASSMKSKLGQAFSVGAILAFGKAAVDAFNEQDAAIASVRQGLESTRGAADRTLDELIEDAGRLQQTSLFGDEQILQNVTGQLLTFTNIAGEQFDRTQQAAVDLAARLGGPNANASSLQSAALQLGKALNDPVSNLGALSRAGIQFSDEQKELIKTLFETGQEAQAQNVILDELERQYGGTAAAVAEAGSGSFTQFKNNVGDLTEVIGGLIVDGLQPVVGALNGVVTWVKNLEGPLQSVVTGGGAAAAALGALALAFGPVGVAIGAVVGAVVLLMKHWDEIVTWIKKTFPQAWKSGEKTIAAIEKAFDDVVREVTRIWERFGDDILNALSFAGRVVAGFVDDAIGYFSVFIQNVRSIIDFVSAIFRGDWSAAFDAAREIATRTFDFIRSFVLKSVDRLLEGASAVVGFFNDDWAQSIDALREKYTTLDEEVGDANASMAGSTDAVKKAAEDAGRTIPPTLDPVPKAFKKIGDAAEDAKERTVTAMMITAEVIGGTDSEIAAALSKKGIERALESMKKAADDSIGAYTDPAGSDTVIGKLRGIDAAAVEAADAIANDPQTSMAAGASVFDVATATAGQTFEQAFGQTKVGGIVNGFMGAFGEGGSITSLFLPGGPFAGLLFGLLDAFGIKLDELVGQAVSAIADAVASIPEAIRPGSPHSRGVRAVLEATESIARSLIEDEPDISPQELLSRLVAFAQGEVERQGIHIAARDLESMIRQLLIDIGIFEPGGTEGQGFPEIETLLATAGIAQSTIDAVVNFLRDALRAQMEIPDVAAGLRDFDLPAALIGEILSIFGNLEPRQFGGLVTAGRAYLTHGLGRREFFFPDVSGSVVTARDVASMLRSGAPLRRMASGGGRFTLEGPAVVRIGERDLSGYIFEVIREAGR